jgi:hypothetical protein
LLPEQEGAIDAIDGIVEVKLADAHGIKIVVGPV